MTYQSLTTCLPLSLRLNPEKLKLKRLIFIVTVFVVLPLLAFYLFQLGKIVSQSYSIKNHQEQLEKLGEENLGLEAKLANLSSLEKIEEKIKDSDFVKVSQVKYIPISVDYLVRK